MSQDSLLTGNSTTHSQFGLDFFGNQYDCEGQHQTASDAKVAQWTSSSLVGEFAFFKFLALGHEGSALDNVFGYANNNDQYRNSEIRQDEPTLERLVAHRIP
jgi:hypothetical protein